MHNRSMLVRTLDRSDLIRIVKALNSPRDLALRMRLRHLVEAWKNATPQGPDLHVLLSSEPELKRYLQQAVTTVYRSTASGQAQLELIAGPVIETGEAVRRYRRRVPEEVEEELRLLRRSVFLFALLTLNPRWADLGGPCKRCDQYYVKKRRSQDTYCSARCGRATTATASVSAERARRHQADLNRASKAVGQWSQLSTPLGWKQWTSRKTGLSVKWLTRASNKGQLQPPFKD